MSIIDYHNMLGIHPLIHETKTKGDQWCQVLYINVKSVEFVMQCLLCTKWAYNEIAQYSSIAKN